MWWYNIIGDNEGSISYLLRLYPINAGSILITANLVATKRENYEPILIVKRTEWRKFIDCFGLSIDSDPSKVNRKKVHFFHIGSLPIASSVKLHISSQIMDKKVNLEPPKLRLCQLTQNIAAKISPHLYFALRDLGVIFDKYFLSRSTILAGEDCAGTVYSCYVTQNKK